MPPFLQFLQTGYLTILYSLLLVLVGMFLRATYTKIVSSCSEEDMKAYVEKALHQKDMQMQEKIHTIDTHFLYLRERIDEVKSFLDKLTVIKTRD